MTASVAPPVAHPHDRLVALLDELGLDLDASRATITGADPVLPCRYPIGEAAAAAHAATGLAASRLWELRGGRPQDVGVDVRHAAAALRGFLDQVVDGAVLDPDPTSKLDAVGLFTTADGRWVQTYGVFPPLKERTLEVLGCRDERAAVAAAVARWDAEPLVDALNAAGAPGAVVLTAQEWERHPQGGALRAMAPVVVERIGDAPPEPPGRRKGVGARPLSGVRVLDLTRILAGPAVGRCLAEHGADVLQVGAARLPVVQRALLDTSAGKRSALLDLDDAADRRTLDDLVLRADVVSQNVRPGTLARRGLGPQELAARRPGLVYVSADTYGHVGPWRDRPGFEPLAQASCGWAFEHAEADPDGRLVPRIVPALPCDYGTGFLAALGVLVALLRRAEEGGSWHVRTSLARTATWFRDQPGRVEPAAPGALGAERTRDLRRPVRGGFGEVQQLEPVVRMSATPTGWDLPAEPPGTHAPRFGT